jgi:hypothetical protein
MAGKVAEAIDVNGAHLLNQDLGLGAFDFDLGSEGRCSGTCGCRRNQDHGTRECASD